MMKYLFLTIIPLFLPALAVVPVVQTATGPIIGSEVAPGVLSWKGIPFAVPPIGPRRWTAPILDRWTTTRNTTVIGSACIQRLNKSEAATDPGQIFYNTPPLAEDEDCLTINVWAPSKFTGKPKAVLFWIYGNAFQFGGSGTFFYDGTSFAQNQDVIIVSHNYRTNVFGFPSSPDIPVGKGNLGLLDQKLALLWTKDNIAKFGGDPEKITLFGLSAGSGSVALLMEHFPRNPPFHAAILQSGVNIALDTIKETASGEDFSAWNNMVAHFGCPSASGSAQLDCMRKVPANDLVQFSITQDFLGPQADGGITISDHPTQLLETGRVARVPIMIGDDAQGASFLTIGENNFTEFVSQPPWNSLPSDELHRLYPVPEKYADDAQAIIALATDFQFRCPTAVFSNIFSRKRLGTIYRFIYGAVLPEFQLFPNAGAPEGSELPFVFGNVPNATNPTEVSLSNAMQTIWANFAKNPNRSPAPRWPAYEPVHKAIVNLAFGDNVTIDNIVQLANTSDADRACGLLGMIQR